LDYVFVNYNISQADQIITILMNDQLLI